MAPSVAEPKFAYFDSETNPFKSKSAQKYNGPSPYAEKGEKAVVEFKGPQKPSGALDAKHSFNELTPVIGREYPDVQLSELLKDDELLRDLAITISHRGVVFFKNQDITPEQQKVLADKLGKLTGKPETSGLHIHPTAPAGGVLKEGTDEIDPEVSIISSRLQKKLYINNTGRRYGFNDKPYDNHGWHSDITFEPVPSDYAILKIVETPAAGGDTLWHSGYAVYDEISPSLREYLKTLTGTYSQPGFKKALDNQDVEFYSGPRGSPENVGDELTAIHPIIRTNPVTGWNSVFALGEHFTKINEVTQEESNILSSYIVQLVLRNHENRVRYKWNKNDVAIWDNRSVFHNATKDIYKYNTEERSGVRTVGIGERPFLHKDGKSRSDEVNGQPQAYN